MDAHVIQSRAVYIRVRLLFNGGKRMGKGEYSHALPAQVNATHFNLKMVSH